MEGIDKVQILSDEVKILKNEIKDILVEIKEMLITLPQNMATSYSLDESGSPKNERPAPEYNQLYAQPSNISAPNSGTMPQAQIPNEAAAHNISGSLEHQERKPDSRKEVNSGNQWLDEEEIQLKETRERAKEDSKLQEESEDTGKVAHKENKKEMLKKEIEKEEESDQSAIPASPAGDVDIVTLATFSRWLNSGMSRLGKERMQEIIEVSAAMGGISSTMRDILLRLLLMDNGQGYIVKESLAVLIDLENILNQNKKSKDGAAVLSLFMTDRDGVRG